MAARIESVIAAPNLGHDPLSLQDCIRALVMLSSHTSKAGPLLNSRSELELESLLIDLESPVLLFLIDLESPVLLFLVELAMEPM